MHISRIEIRNFRSIRHLVLALGDTTVFVGPNNAGKTAILDALRVALTGRWDQSGTGFSEYDIHMPEEDADPKKSSGTCIEIGSEEGESGEWPATVQQDLADILRVDVVTGRRSVSLRTRYGWNEDTDSFEPSWEFLDFDQKPLVGPGAHRINLERFRRYLPVFHLGPLRDAGDEFSRRSSKFWTRLLKGLRIAPEFEAQALQAMDRINQKLLSADPQLAVIADTLSGVTRIAARNRQGRLDLRMTPLKTWDLLSRAEIILRNEPGRPWLPLRRQGQGIQSLSVIFLFRAFVEHRLKELHGLHSEPILALEEPETHLHPHAVRTLWKEIDDLPGQKIVTTHSPYFVQHVPFRDIRLVRLSEKGTGVRSLPAYFSTTFSDLDADLDGLPSVVEHSSGHLTYEKISRTLTVHGTLKKGSWQGLLKCCRQSRKRSDFESRLSDLKDRSSLHVSDEDLRGLETHARRMRGEIFFADWWFLVEGQTEHHLVHAVADALDYNLDRHGVSVIDVQNNGNPAIFAALARALDVPWLAVFDGDQQGKEYIRRIGKRGFGAEELEARCRTHPAGDLEEQLVADGFGPELRRILLERGIDGVGEMVDSDLVRRLRERKMGYAMELAVRIRRDPLLAERAPEAFRKTLAALRGSA